MSEASGGFFPPNHPTNPIQKQLARLEADGVVVSQLIGKVRSYSLNPHYPFITPLKQLLKAAVETYPPELISELLVQRTRPRQAGKSLLPVNSRAGAKG